MGSNSTTLMDEDGAYPDWIELHNPDPAPFNLNGWYLTDSATNKLKWQFPAVTIPPGGYLVVFASGQDRRDPANRLHTNFALAADGEYLALVRADGTSVASEYSPEFPRQSNDVSFGPVGTDVSGPSYYLARPTPGASNSGARPIGIAETVVFSQAAGPFANPFSLTLSGAASGRNIRYVITPAAAGAGAADPTASSPLYSAPIAIDGATVVRAALFSADGQTRGPARTAYYSKISSGLAAVTSALPVLVIDTLGSGPLAKDGVDHAAWLHSYTPRGNNAPVFSAAPDLVSPLTTTVRGSSSAEFPKKGYNLKFADDLGNDSSPAWLDLDPHGEWVLTAPWKFDHNYINNPLIYRLSERLGRWAPRTRMAEVYFNANGNEIDASDYAGIYVITDRIEVDSKRIDLAKLNRNEVSGNDLTGGYILKIDTPDPNEFGWRTSRGFPNNLGASIVVVSPSAANIAPAQLTYIRDYVQRLEEALIASRDSGWAQRTYLDYLDRAAWVDHHILNTFAANPDAFQRSAYFTKDRNGRLAAGPVWDFDRALGSYWDERSYRYDVWFGIGAANVWETGWWGILARDPEFMQDWIDRWQSLRRSEFSNGSLAALVDSLTANLSAAAARDAARWPDNTPPAPPLPNNTHAEQISHFKGWLAVRAEWIDGQFVAPPAATATGANLTFTPPEGAELAYTLDGSDPRSLGGAVAPNAILTSSPLSVPAAANVHVRSYRASLRGVYPGSPWSAAVGGASSSPLAPVARLVNISSRAVVGTGENALITGVIVADTGSKRYLSRAIGPALGGFGVTNFLPDPQLAIYGGATELFRNSGWETGQDAARLPSYARSVGAFALPEGSRDSALANILGAGAYTVQITTLGTQPGVGLAELYELDTNGRTINLSTRASVQTGSGVLIGGFVVQGPAYKRILVRAVGPTLGAFGVSEFLRDPILTLYSGQTVMASNDRWEAAPNATTIRAASKVVGAFDLLANGEDAALLITLPEGAYTVEVKGKDSGVGVALLEIYDVP